ncbi:MAG: transposase [Candidatus Synoicihabitans palmerolidicus]|nr:transposase [Candidatus Synoicihabitans palmerolidicus]
MILAVPTSENTHRGHRALIKHLQSLPNARVVCKATGGYERAIVAALLLAQIQVCVVNPGRVRAFARAAGLLAKTDPLDAQRLRRFGLQMKPRLHRALDERPQPCVSCSTIAGRSVINSSPQATGASWPDAFFVNALRSCGRF